MDILILAMLVHNNYPFLFLFQDSRINACIEGLLKPAINVDVLEILTTMQFEKRICHLKKKTSALRRKNKLRMDSTGCQNENKEQRQLYLMRREVETQDTSAEAIDDATLGRFLRARNFNVEKASELFLKYLKWRRAFVPLGYIPESEVSNELENKKIFIQGFDKQGRPIGVILAARHDGFNRDMEEFKRLVVYGFDKICARLPTGQEKFIIIADLEGWGYRNADVRGYLAALAMMQDFYPERLGKVLMVHVPYLFWAAWKMVYPFVDKVTKKKIIFVEDKHLRETLLNDIDGSQLPEIYGGKLALVPAQDCDTSNCPPVTSS